mgnify:FL=1
MNNQLMNVEEQEMNIFEQGNQKPAYCSIVAETFEDKAKIFNAMSSPDERLRNHINEIIKIRDVYCEIVECTNKDTGETSEAPRVVLIDTEGKSYQCVSTGIFNSLKRLFTVFGMPTWEKGVPCKVKQVSNGERQILTLVVANK